MLILRAFAVLVAALIVCYLTEPAAHGQGCYYGGYRQGGYYSPPPAYSYGHSFYQSPPYQQPYQQPYAQKIVAQEVAVAPLIVTVPIDSRAIPINAYGASHYYSVQEAYQQRAMVRTLIREELRSYLQGGGVDQAPTPARPALPGPGKNPVNPPPVAVPGGANKVTDLGVDSATDPRLAQAVLAAWEKGTCMKCHAGDEVSGRLRLAYVGNDGKYRLAKQSIERAWTVYGMMSTGMMPKEARKDASKAAPPDTLPPVLQWVVNGVH